MKKKILIIAIAVLAIITVAIGWWYYQKSHKASNAIEQAGDLTGNLGREAAKGTMPSINTNPMENAPDTNPVSKTNPFSNIKTNPFK